MTLSVNADHSHQSTARSTICKIVNHAIKSPGVGMFLGWPASCEKKRPRCDKSATAGAGRPYGIKNYSTLLARPDVAIIKVTFRRCTRSGTVTVSRKHDLRQSPAPLRATRDRRASRDANIDKKTLANRVNCRAHILKIVTRDVDKKW